MKNKHAVDPEVWFNAANGKWYVDGLGIYDYEGDARQAAAASLLGRKGRAKNTQAQKDASAINGKKGGRPTLCKSEKAQGGYCSFREGDGWRTTCYHCGRKR